MKSLSDRSSASRKAARVRSNQYNCAVSRAAECRLSVCGQVFSSLFLYGRADPLQTAHCLPMQIIGRVMARTESRSPKKASLRRQTQNGASVNLRCPLDSPEQPLICCRSFDQARHASAKWGKVSPSGDDDACPSLGPVCGYSVRQPGHAAYLGNFGVKLLESRGSGGLYSPEPISVRSSRVPPSQSSEDCCPAR
jgi:hypothetical protein